jgi:hypothetical protein
MGIAGERKARHTKTIADTRCDHSMPSMLPRASASGRVRGGDREANQREPEQAREHVLGHVRATPQ